MTNTNLGTPMTPHTHTHASVAAHSSTPRRPTLRRWLLLAVASLFPLAAQAQLTFTFTYSDPAGVGFNDAAQGPARRASLEQTAALAASYLPGYTANITMSVDGAETTDGVLAAAGSNTTDRHGVCNPGFGARGDVGVKVLGGADPDPNAVDGTVTVNFEDQTWGLGDTIAATDFDFKSTMLHELLHAIGFSNSIDQAGASACSQAPGTPASWNPYDNFLGDTTGDVINDTSFVLDGARWAAIVTGGAGNAGVLWRGPQGIAGNGGQPVPLNSPATFSNGSSIAHLDDEFFTNVALLMEAATEQGQGTRTLSDREVGMLKDLGFANATGTPGGGGGGATPNYTATWFNAAESGWGMTIAHQGDVLFPAWYTYSSSGQVQWYIVSGAARTANGSYVGPIFRFTGRPFSQINGGQAFLTSVQVGTATLSFPTTNTMTFNYTVDGIAQSKSLSRFTFGAAPTCTFTTAPRTGATNYSDIWNLSSESGWGITFDHQGDNIFAAWYTYGSNGNPQWITGLASRQADGSFKGDLNRPANGTPFNQINGMAATTFPVPKVGEFELRFSNGENASFKYTLDGIEQTKAIARFTFATPVTVCN